MLCWCGFGPGGDVDDDRFAVADGDVPAGERLKLGGQIAGAAVLVDAGLVVAGPKLAKSGLIVRREPSDSGDSRSISVN
jgi:hypothetical protein